MQPARCVCKVGEVSFLWSRLRAEVSLVVMESIIDVDYLYCTPSRVVASRLRLPLTANSRQH